MSEQLFLLSDDATTDADSTGSGSVDGTSASPESVASAGSARRPVAMRSPDRPLTPARRRSGAEGPSAQSSPVPIRELSFRFRLSEQTRRVGLDGVARARAALAAQAAHEEAA
jgi:hypothetical protein